MNLPRWLKVISPLADRMSTYQRQDFVADLVAGLVVAIMLVPQAMAYAMLAGLPPQIGLYASIVPLVLYSFLGTSNTLSVGPVAMVSLLVVSGLSEFAEPGSQEFISLCLTLALLVGLLQILMAIFRMGFLVNFISHPVLIGFTSAAAIVIGFSQVKHLIGVSLERHHYPFQLIFDTLSSLGNANATTVVIGLVSCGLLWFFRDAIAPLLKRMGFQANVANVLAKAGPLVAVALMATLVFLGDLSGVRQVAVVGEIPAGLPSFTLPALDFETVRKLLPLAVVITLVGYLESISVAKALARSRNEKLSANRELLALGMADVGAALTGGYPVTGGFSRSLVNFSAGARTPAASIITALFVAVSVAFLTPLFFYIPKAVLAAIIIVAVIGLVDFKTPVKLWKYSRTDAAALLVTFCSVLLAGIETGILIGLATTIMVLVWKMSRPNVVEVGRVGTSEQFRSSQHHNAHVTNGILSFRMDESLNFANAPFLESYVLEQVSKRQNLDSVLLICSGINDLDSTGIEVLEMLKRELDANGIGFYLSDVKHPVYSRLQLAGFEKSFLDDNVFMSAHEAICKLESQRESLQPFDKCAHPKGYGPYCPTQPSIN